MMNFIQPVNLFCLLLCINHIRADNKTNNHCCPPGQAMLLRSPVCWDPKTNLTGALTLNCTEYVRFRNFTITEDNKMQPYFESVEVEPAEKYCLANTTTIKDIAFKNLILKAAACADENTKVTENRQRVLGYCMIVSLLFLVPTALVYSALPELRDVQGKSIINFCTSLAIAQGILAIMKLMEFSNMSLCATRGFLAYFFILVAFFWTNAISIQVLLNTRRPSTLDYSWHEFKWYFIYAWGTPTVLTACMAIVNFHPGKHQKPGIGLNHCWFFDIRQQWYYMFSVMSILLAANIAIFIYVTVIIWRLTFSSNHLKVLKYKLIMSIRLIVLMGLPWVFEMIGSLAGEHIIWSIIDVFNCLQGILIFLLLVIFRRRVIKIMYKHGWLKCISGAVEKHLAFEDDEENVVQHTEVMVSMNDRTTL